MPVEPHVHVTARRVLAAIGVTASAALVETAVSRVAGSLFLVADALHLVAHLGIFVVLLLPARGRHAVREDVATCAVLALVIGIAAALAFRSASSLVIAGGPPRPEALLFSLLGLGANLTTAWLFRDPAQTRWSFRAALAHEISDASLTIVGLLGAAAIALFGFRWVDPGLSLAVAVWLGAWAARLIVRRIRVGRTAWELPTQAGRPSTAAGVRELL